MSRARARAAASLLLVLLLVGTACRDGADRAERDRVLRSIDALRDSPSADLVQRAARIADLEATPATLLANVTARDTCASAYRLLLDATVLQQGIEADLGGKVPSATLVTRLQDADAKIKATTERMPECERAIAALRLRR